jgi:hypothetical protein
MFLSDERCAGLYRVIKGGWFSSICTAARFSAAHGARR